MLAKQDMINKGFQYFAERNYEKAEIFFRKAIEMDRTFEAAYKALSETLNRMGRIDDAIAVVHQWLRVNNNAAAAHHALSRLYVQKGWLTEAEKEMALWRVLAGRS